MSSTHRQLGYLSLALMNISAIISLRHLPGMAAFGLSSFSFYVLGALVFLIPIAMICAELATTWPEQNGLYGWIQKTFGPRWAFIVVWWSWMSAIAAIMSNLSVLGSILSYAYVDPIKLSQGYDMTISFIVLWGLTFMNIFGVRLSSFFSGIGAVVGTLFPTYLLVFLAFVWWVMGRSQVAFEVAEVIPLTITQDHFAFFGNVILGYSGIELAAFHVNASENPQRDYSKAIFISVLAILAIYILGTMSIAIVLPIEDINLRGGVVQVFSKFFESFGLPNLGVLISMIVAVGTMASINTWLISPARGVFAAMAEFKFPNWIAKVNRNDVPVPLLIVQATIASVLLGGGYFFAGSAVSFFWWMNTMTTQFTLLLYVMMILAVIRFRRLYPGRHRPYKIPDQIFYPLTIACLLTCLLVFCFTFIPPTLIGQIDIVSYEIFFVGGLILLSIPPLLFKKIKK